MKRKKRESIIIPIDPHLCSSFGIINYSRQVEGGEIDGNHFVALVLAQPSNHALSELHFHWERKLLLFILRDKTTFPTHVVETWSTFSYVKLSSCPFWNNNDHPPMPHHHRHLHHWGKTPISAERRRGPSIPRPFIIPIIPISISSRISRGRGAYSIILHKQWTQTPITIPIHLFPPERTPYRPSF